MHDLQRLLKQHRTAVQLKLTELATASGVSASHLGRIERGERLPSAYTLRRIAEPLALDEGELFTLAGFLSPIPTEDAAEKAGDTFSRLDPYVTKLLAEESFEMQRCVLGILSVLRSLAKSMARENLHH